MDWKALTASLFLAAVTLGAGESAAVPPPIHVTTGAAPGYVDDALCGSCHVELYRSYQQVGMARAFSRPAKDNAIEDFGKEFVHARSKQIFQFVWRDRRLIFRQYQRDQDGRELNTLEIPVDWILGSGNHARVYLYQTPAGELYQLPLAWYSQEKSWGMAPGYDRPDHDGVGRRVRHECMFCHNGYPDIASSNDGYWRSQTFPRALPEGTGCQRCHGPGAKHVIAMKERHIEQAAATIVNPARLTPRQRKDVCYQCHLMPAVSVQGARLLGRDVYSFRPGQALSDYELPLELKSTKRSEERFEISQHAYRLEQSRCMRESAGRLSCLTCHDPHRVVPEAERAAHYRQACLGCHETIAADGVQHTAAGREQADCAGCHMPKRRTDDVVHVVMTDHRISRQPAGPELLAPRDEHDASFDTVAFFEPSAAPRGAEGELYRLLPLMRAGLNLDPASTSYLSRALAKSPPQAVEPLFDLANAQASQKQWSDLEATCRTILARAPEHPLALAWLGLARGGLGDKEQAMALQSKAVALDPDRAGFHFNLALALQSAGKDAEAIAELERATALRPTLPAAWLALAEMRARRGETAAAILAFKRALALEPADSRAYVGLGRALISQGDQKAARELWQHALSAAGDRRAIESALAKLKIEN